MTKNKTIISETKKFKLSLLLSAFSYFEFVQKCLSTLEPTLLKQIKDRTDYEIASQLFDSVLDSLGIVPPEGFIYKNYSSLEYEPLLRDRRNFIRSWNGKPTEFVKQSDIDALLSGYGVSMLELQAYLDLSSDEKLKMDLLLSMATNAAMKEQ